MPNVITPDLCDEFPNKVEVFTPGLKHYGGSKNFYGQIVTIACFEDNSKVGQMLRHEKGQNKVLVVDGGASMRRALLGDMLAEAAVNNEWAGIVINGCVRDVEMLKPMNIGIMALGAIPLKTQKRDLGDVNVALEIFGVVVNPGAYIYADETGVLVAPHDLFKAH